MDLVSGKAPDPMQIDEKATERLDEKKLASDYTGKYVMNGELLDAANHHTRVLDDPEDGFFTPGDDVRKYYNLIEDTMTTAAQVPVAATPESEATVETAPLPVESSIRRQPDYQISFYGYLTDILRLLHDEDGETLRDIAKVVGVTTTASDDAEHIKHEIVSKIATNRQKCMRNKRSITGRAFAEMPDEFVVYDDTTQLCYDILELQKRFLANNRADPYRNVPFSKEFRELVRDRYKSLMATSRQFSITKGPAIRWINRAKLEVLMNETDMSEEEKSVFRAAFFAPGDATHGLDLFASRYLRTGLPLVLAIGNIEEKRSRILDALLGERTNYLRGNKLKF